MKLVHDFNEQLAYSEEASAEPFWRAVYQKAFPNMVSCVPTFGDYESQRLGIDRKIFLANGKTLKTDEKKRKKVYPDFCLEYISIDTTGAPGWMEKDLSIDYLAYAYMPIRRCYLLPWLPLRRAWNHFKIDWIKQYRRVEAENKNYTTISVPVPRNVVMQAIKPAQALIIQLPKDYKEVYYGRIHKTVFGDNHFNHLARR